MGRNPRRDAANAARGAAPDLFAGAADIAVTGKVLQVPVRVVDAEAGTIAFTDEDGSEVEQSALSGLGEAAGGKSTGRCAGPRSESIMKCRART
jgi:hypothetical protein